jgi:hypothetical protein
MLHVMVADLFQLRRPKIMVSFKDGNRWNARLSNLMAWGQNPRHKLTEPQYELARELFKKYPQRKIVSELADRFMVNYKTMWDFYKEFQDENTIAGVRAYEHLYTNTPQRLLRGVSDLHVRQECDILRPIERHVGIDSGNPDTESR